jgi:cell division protein FtsW
MKRHINYYFLAISAILLVCGILFLSTLSAIASLQVFGNTTHYVFHQLIAVAIGLFFGAIAFKIPLPFLKKVAPILLALNVLALFAVFLPGVGTKFGGASRWISIGGIAFQPSEFFKITIILYFSAWLANRFSPSSTKNWVAAAKKGYDSVIRVFLPFLLFLVIIGIVFFLQSDISTLGIISVSLIAIYFMAETPLWQTVVTVLGGIGGGLILIITEPYRFHRILTFLNPSIDPLGIGHQAKQSKLAIGSGGLFGKGLGMSVQKFGFLPESMTDSIFAVIGEELGLIGCTILVGLFVSFTYLGFKIAAKATDKFSRLTAIGFSTWIIFQTFINMASAIGLFPLSGIPLPFFSYGGSHMISEIIAVGIILNISKNG